MNNKFISKKVRTGFIILIVFFSILTAGASISGPSAAPAVLAFMLCVTIILSLLYRYSRFKKTALCISGLISAILSINFFITVITEKFTDVGSFILLLVFVLSAALLFLWVAIVFFVELSQKAK